MVPATRLGFAGDVMLGRGVDRAQHARPESAVWGDLLETLRDLDGLFVNLECALSTRGTPWRRTYRRFHFRANPGWAVPALGAAGVDCASLANNHLLDYEVEALRDTLDHLDAAGIAHAGAGVDERAAREPAVVDCGGLRVAVVAFTDNTPEYAVGPETPGVAYVEFDDEGRRVVERALARARAYDPDVLVASLHWGPNMRTEPPEQFRAFGRWLVEQGVDLVHGHSAHLFQGVEVHEGRPICYDTGDFVDDYRVDPVHRNDRSFLFTLVIEGGDPTELRLLPTEIRDFRVHHASGETADWCRRTMRERSAAFDTPFERDGETLVVPLAGRTKS